MTYSAVVPHAWQNYLCEILLSRSRPLISVRAMIYGDETSEHAFEYLGIYMHFQRAKELAENTPTHILCEAWGLSVEGVELSRLRVHQLTVEQAGELAALHGLTLPDILVL